MTENQLITDKLSQVKKYFNLVKKYRRYSKADLQTDHTLKGAVERYLYLLCQSAIDFAETVISQKQLRKPATYGEVFEILAEAEIISTQISHKMIKMAGFRNVLTHAYGAVDFDIVFSVLQKDSDDISEFIDEIEQSLHF